ncbi:hypothetical protein PT974_01549 [Cladobotryum mycophilum]|uniref:NACHT domain-containing protein n=1 Tax=Cladobotryum mycophilum TaxID=491253 RepID=A0ABR0T4A1_9HYPO
MVDPLTALGAASSIIAILEFSWKLLASTQKIYQMGENEGNATLSTISQDARRLADSIVSSEDYSKDLQALVKESRKVAQELIDALEKLKVQGKKTMGKSFMVALKEIWNKGKIEAFSQKLAKLQAQVASHVQILILNGVSDISHVLSELDRTSKTLGIEVKTELQALRADVIVAADKVSYKDSSYEESLKKLLRAQKNTGGLDQQIINEISARLLGFSEKLTDFRQAAETAEDDQRLLVSLHFDAIKTRQNKIPAAHAKTFGWIFQNSLPSESQPRPIKFVDWLEYQAGVFWIQGKPGSGKSTPMKFLFSHEETIRHLRSWAGDEELVTTSYFFWHAGSQLQKSQEGLLRMLLFDILRRCPHLIPRVRSLRLELGDGWNNDWSWITEELLAVCNNLFQEAIATKFCVFIDGLDEYEGTMTTEDLVKTIQVLGSVPSMKLCISSRPWSVFADAFGSLESSLKLEDLTRNDIRKYVTDKFDGNTQFRKLKEAGSISSELIDDICQRARGVFLWVYLVVRDILQGFTNGDSVGLLQSRLERFPEDLEEFFKHMIDTIPPIYMQQTARLFDIAKSSSEPQYVMAYSFIDEIEAEPEFIFKHPVEILLSMTETEMSFRQDRVRRQLDARCRGLLEITSDAESLLSYFYLKVDFLHRTVQEFLIRQDGLGPLFREKLGSFSTASVMCTAIVAMLERLPHPDDGVMAMDHEIRNLLNSLFYWARQEDKGPENSEEIVKILNKADTLFTDYRFWNDFPRPSFLGLACEHGIVCYVEAKLPDPRLGKTLSCGGKPLLAYALALSGEISPSIVKALLKHGADPNEKYIHLTVWLHFVKTLQGSLTLENKNIRDVIKILTTHGADLRAGWTTTRIRSGGPSDIEKNRVVSLQVIAKYFSPEEIKELQQMQSTTRKWLNWFKNIFRELPSSKPRFDGPDLWYDLRSH